MSNSLQPHKLQHSRLLCPPLSPRVCSNSHPLHQWCYLTISSSATPFSFCFQSFPASGSFLTSWLFTSGGQSVRASASVFPINIQGWFSLGWTGLIFLQSKGLSKLFSSPTVQKCVYIYIYIYIYIHTHTHIYTHTHIFTHTYIHTHIHTHTYIHNSVGPWTTWVWTSWVHIQIFFNTYVLSYYMICSWLNPWMWNFRYGGPTVKL